MLAEGRVIGRYEIHDELASGGMATVHLGRLVGPVGFSRAVAIKRMHTFLARDPEFVAMFLDEARLASRIRHQNVVPTLDVVASDGELFLVMEYVLGESLSRTLAANAATGARIPLPVTSAIVIGLLEGLHAAHEAKDERGAALHIVHRDVSPQNVLVGADGVARVFDFGVAKAIGRMQTTEDGSLRGKLAYMAPEQLRNEELDRRTDVWACGVVLWEMLTNERLFIADSPGALVGIVLTKQVPPPSVVCACPVALDAVVATALRGEKSERFATAREMALALELAVPPASPRTVADWLDRVAGPTVRAREALIEDMDRSAKAHRPSKGTVRTRLAALGYEGRADARAGSLPADEVATQAAGGRVVQRTAEAALVAAPLPPLPPLAPPPTSRPPRLWRLVARSVLISAVCAALGIGAWSMRRQPSASSVALPASSASASASSPIAPAIASVTRAEPSPASSTAPSAGPTITARRSPRAPASVAHPAGSMTAPPAPNCDPPYTIGPPPDLIKKPKLECLPP